MKIFFGGDDSGISNLTDNEIIYIMESLHDTGSAGALAFDLGTWLKNNPDRFITLINRSVGSNGQLPQWMEAAKNEAIAQRPELMGLFGLSWQEKIISFMKSQLKTNKELLKKLSSWWGENTRLVDNLHREYTALLATGSNPVSFVSLPDTSGSGGELSAESTPLATKIAAKTSVDKEIIESFLRALFVLSRDGKIDFKKIDPKGYIESKEAQKKVTTEPGILDTIKSGSNKIFLLAGLGLSLYLLNSLKGLNKNGTKD